MAFLRIMAKIPYNLLAGLAQEMLEGNAPVPGQLWARINCIDVARRAGAFRLTSGKTGPVADSSGFKRPAKT